MRLAVANPAIALAVKNAASSALCCCCIVVNSVLGFFVNRFPSWCCSTSLPSHPFNCPRAAAVEVESWLYHTVVPAGVLVICRRCWTTRCCCCVLSPPPCTQNIKQRFMCPAAEQNGKSEASATDTLKVRQRVPPSLHYFFRACFRDGAWRCCEGHDSWSLLEWTIVLGGWKMTRACWDPQLILVG